MTKVVPFSQECRHSALHGRGRRRPQASNEVAEPTNQFRRHDQETEAQRRADGLAETANVQQPSPMIEGSKSRSRSSFQLQLAQVIVFNNVSAVPPSPCEQCKSPRRRHRHPERRLLAWCHNCQRGSGGAPDASVQAALPSSSSPRTARPSAPEKPAVTST